MYLVYFQDADDEERDSGTESDENFDDDNPCKYITTSLRIVI
jgi:hypothetical protein